MMVAPKFAEQNADFRIRITEIRAKRLLHLFPSLRI